ncbi:MAG: neutral/alkaline non-lysosomal ceramidase N-terminal domain-containing protein [Gemmataceae bacterium]|nr:neutral/alkaline non-lysosomal ceramidase N-terminal domain-containing protein [Gemmataceae bacterium]
MNAQELQAGAAKIEITPPLGFPMWGYGVRHDAPSVGVLDPLQARALVLAAGSERLALVSLDLGRAPTRQSTAAIRARVKATAGIEHLFLVATHTHHGPVLEVETWPNSKEAYVRQLEQKIGDVIVAAAQALRPARLGIASRQVARNRNRHSKRPDQPVDRELLVLRLEGHDAKPIALAVNFAAHPTMHEAKLHQFSADYPGALADLVEKETGVPCLFLQGAAGDLSTDSRDEGGPVKFGQALGREVLALARSLSCTSPEKPTLQVREDDFRFGRRFDLGNPLVKAFFVRAFFREIVDFYEHEYREGVRPHLTTALLDGRIGFVGVSGEFFCGHALSLKRRARLEHLFFLGYCNDYQQYFPTIEAAAEGGYGADPTVSPAEVGAGERMMDQALIQLYKMRGRLPSFAPAR